MSKFERETQTIKDLKKVIKLLEKIKQSETFTGIIMDQKYFDNFYSTIFESTSIFEEEVRNEIKESK